MLKAMGLRFMLAVASQRITRWVTARRAQLASASRGQRKRLSLRTCFGCSGSLGPANNTPLADQQRGSPPDIAAGQNSACI